MKLFSLFINIIIIQPQNVLLYIEPNQSSVVRRVKLADFGISKIADKTITNNVSIIGTANYMDPSLRTMIAQYGGSRIDLKIDLKAADVFSFGVVMFELLTKPFTANEIVSSFVIDSSTLQQSFFPLLSNEDAVELCELVRSCISTESFKRPKFQTISLTLLKLLQRIHQFEEMERFLK